MTFDLKKIKTFPLDPGVYLMKNNKGKILYVGKAKNLRNRLKQYLMKGGDDRLMVPFLTAQIHEIDTIITLSEKEALLFENTLIKKHQPKYNILLKDDKTFISLTINASHMWPMIKLVRYKNKPKGKDLCFGPYTSGYAAREVLNLMTRIFQLRQCSDQELKRRSRPCILYQINRCMAPCVKKCTKETYNQEVNHAIAFLKGKNQEVISNLKKEMNIASLNLNYEKAGSILKTIKQIEHITKNYPSVVSSKGEDSDIFFHYSKEMSHVIVKLLFREGKVTGMDSYSFKELASSEEEIWETFLLQHYIQLSDLPKQVLIPISLKNKKNLEEILSKEKGRKVALLTPQKGPGLKLIEMAQKNAKELFDQKSGKEALLLDLKEICHLQNYPARIECFDTSNVGGDDNVASMVAYTNGLLERKRKRLFKIKTVKKSDDYGSMREALTRHYTKAKENDALPDLILVDGGKGQLNITREVLTALEIVSVDVIALAKEDSRHDKGLNRESIFTPHQKEPILLSPQSPTLFLLQKIRDEAHRAAISFHRKRRDKRTIKSSLDDVTGIGPKKRTLILKHFGSVSKLKKASKEELEEIKGLSKKDIKALIAYIVTVK